MNETYTAHRLEHFFFIINSYSQIMQFCQSYKYCMGSILFIHNIKRTERTVRYKISNL